MRSVFTRFQQEHGVAPLADVRSVRLDRAYALLGAPGQTASVIDIAMRCGFASFGHFARRYRERFGELPSQTLSRSR